MTWTRISESAHRVVAIASTCVGWCTISLRSPNRSAPARQSRYAHSSQIARRNDSLLSKFAPHEFSVEVAKELIDICYGEVDNPPDRIHLVSYFFILCFLEIANERENIRTRHL